MKMISILFHCFNFILDLNISAVRSTLLDLVLVKREGFVGGVMGGVGGYFGHSSY